MSSPQATRRSPPPVTLCSGHMIDLPGRAPRFPQTKEGAVRKAMQGVLADWDVGPETLAICGGARGADILFAESCLDHGAAVRIYLALSVERFVEESVRIPGTDWESRFRKLLDRCEVRHPGISDESVNVFETANRLMLAEAEREAGGRGFRTLLVWDEDRKGAKPGGTASFFDELEKRAKDVRIINPTRLEASP